MTVGTGPWAGIMDLGLWAWTLGPGSWAQDHGPWAWDRVPGTAEAGTVGTNGSQMGLQMGLDGSKLRPNLMGKKSYLIF